MAILRYRVEKAALEQAADSSKFHGELEGIAHGYCEAAGGARALQGG
jgi:hypothetical protein